jgi:hypothetical protein
MVNASAIQALCKVFSSPVSRRKKWGWKSKADLDCLYWGREHCYSLACGLVFDGNNTGFHWLMIDISNCYCEYSWFRVWGESAHPVDCTLQDTSTAAPIWSIPNKLCASLWVSSVHHSQHVLVLILSLLLRAQLF